MEKLKDSDIRLLLKQKFASFTEFTLDPSTIIVDEMDVCFGSARVDVAVINGKLHGYEIKSERDNLDRLPSQIDFYSKIFDTMTLVVSKVHLEKARGIVPKWWGIDCVLSNKKSEFEIKTIRKPKQNTKVDMFDLTQLLWKNELLELLESNNIIKGMKSKSRYELGNVVVKNFSPCNITEFVKQKLKSREEWRAVPIQQLCGDLQLL
ncbi:sce7726 family protein [Paenibacillus macerans]|uniref:sce7726 family protein n=1 Tax=Paenibacillus macerans TaxID=44252 RepID=UPI002DBE2B80|nr:sce7726 family protein [Paenibacillus macerans]MEC0329405.1 sce7726 family protein [Paenibacillus macerans]